MMLFNVSIFSHANRCIHYAMLTHGQTGERRVRKDGLEVYCESLICRHLRRPINTYAVR